MKIQLTILCCLVLIFSPGFVAFGQQTQPIELLKPKNTIAIKDTINIAINSPKSNVNFGSEWSLIKKTEDRSDGKFESPFKPYNSSFSPSVNRNFKQSIKESSSFPNDLLYIGLPLSIIRSLTSKGDYGNLFSIGLSFGAIFGKFDFSMIAFDGGFGRTKEDISYYHETLEAGATTSGARVLVIDFGYNILTVKNVRISPMIGFCLVNSFSPHGKNSGLTKYSIEELYILEVGLNTYYKFSNKSNSFIKLSYRYQPNISKKDLYFPEEVHINKHIFSLGIFLGL